MLLFMEISTHFIATRWLLFDHKVVGGTFLQTLNTVLLAVTFIFGRVFFQIYVVIFYGSPWLRNALLTSGSYDKTYKAVLATFALSVFVNMILNFYWSWLIIKQILRMITRGFSSDTAYSNYTPEAK